MKPVGLNRTLGLLIPPSIHMPMAEVQEPEAVMLYWAERPNYKTKQKERKVLQQFTLPEKKGERHKRAKLPKEKLEHLPVTSLQRI